MSLFKLKTVERERNVNVYARSKGDIIDLVTYYQERVKKNSHLDDPRLSEWVKKIPSSEDIMTVERGEMLFQCGMIDFGGDNDRPFFEHELKVVPDFSVFINGESLPHFESYVLALPNLKRCNLYKIQVTGGLYPNLNFIPEDIAKALRDYDIRPHFRKARDSIEKIARVKKELRNL